jgi:hypothetical protein
MGAGGVTHRHPIFSSSFFQTFFYDDILVFIIIGYFFHDIASSSGGRKDDTDPKNGGKYPGDKNRFSCKAGIRAWLSRSPFRR